jgi:hypothetical protein
MIDNREASGVESATAILKANLLSSLGSAENPIAASSGEKGADFVSAERTAAE